jgi:REP-associated tyrosine transposase
MPRLSRVHVARGTYLAGRDWPGLGQSDPDLGGFVGLLHDCARRCRVRVHAYCVHPDGFWSLVTIGSEPVGAYLHCLEAAHTRRGNGHCPNSRPVVLLVDVREYLWDVLRFLHWLPVSLGRADSPGDYPWSSERAYAGERKYRWLTLDLVLDRIGGDRERYRRQMAERPGPEHAKRVMLGPIDPRVLGSDSFLRSLPVRTRRRSTRSFSDMQGAVARVLAVEATDIPARSRDPVLMLARSVLCWQCVHRHVATVDECARELDRHRSTLLRGIQRDRRRFPRYFTFEGVPDLAPLLPTRPVAGLSA